MCIVGKERFVVGEERFVVGKERLVVGEERFCVGEERFATKVIHRHTLRLLAAAGYSRAHFCRG